jgi:hypothetical protein
LAGGRGEEDRASGREGRWRIPRPESWAAVPAGQRRRPWSAGDGRRRQVLGGSGDDHRFQELHATTAKGSVLFVAR